MNRTLQEVYDRLLAAYGPQSWWPGESPFEVLVGAILVQNTSWQNVRKAIDNLRQADLMAPHALYSVPADELEELIRPAGYYRVKARRLRNLLALVVTRYGGSLEAMFQTRPSTLREQLLSVNGIGPETADSILLYAAGQPVFVVDAYTRRIMARLGLAGEAASYEKLQQLFMQHLPPDVRLYNEYHALLVALGKNICVKRMPRCGQCPLEDLCPKKGI